ncbi:hypothetical protein AHAS_Ahas20G0266800 [Arachis hypogaea]
MRCIGFRPNTSQPFGYNSQQPSNGAQTEETQRLMLELQVELVAEKLKERQRRMK